MPLFEETTTLLMSSSLSATILSRLLDHSPGSSGSFPPPSRPRARTLCAWLPRVRMSPPTLALELVDRVLDLLQRHVVLAEQPGVDQHLILLDGPAVTGHVDHARDGLQGALEHPILDGLELVGRVASGPSST